MAAEAGQIALDLVINKKKYDKQLAGITGIAKKAAMTIAAAFSVKKIVDFGKQCIEFGSDLAEVQNVVDVTFPKMTAQADEFAKSAAISFGLSETMAKKFTGTFGSMAKAFGFSEKQAYDMSMTLTGLAGDVASFYNITQDEAYTKLKSVFTGETESLKDLGVVMTQSALDAYALANGFGKTTQKMSEAEKVALRYAFVQKQLTAAAGDFSRTSDGWANQVRILSLQFDSLKATIGQGLINVFTPVLKLVNQLIGKLMVLANSFKAFTEMLTGKKAEENAVSLNNAAGAAESLESATEGAGNAAKKTAKQMKALMGFDKINKMDKPDSGGASSGGVSAGNIDFGSIKTGDGIISGAEKSCSGLIKQFEKLKSLFDKEYISKKLKSIADIGKEIGKTSRNLGLAVGDIFKSVLKDDAVKNIASDICGIWTTVFFENLELFAKIGRDIYLCISQPFIDNKDKITEAITKTLEPISKVVSTVRTGIEDAFAIINKAYDKHITPMFEAFKEGYSDSFGKLLNAYNEHVAPVLQRLADKFNEVYGEHIKPCMEKIGGLIGSIADYVSMCYTEQIKPIVDWIIETLLPILLPVFEAFGKGLMDIFGAIWDIASGIIDALSGVLDFFTGVFTGDWNKAWEGLKKTFFGVVDAIKGALSAIFYKSKTVWDEIKAVFAPASEWFGKVFKDAWKNICSAFDGVATFFNGLWNKIVNVFTDIGTKIGNAVSGAFKASVNSVFSTIENIVNGFIGTINGAIKLINKIPGVEIGKIKTVSLPRLAQGGYVKPNTPQLAMIGDNRHQGEVVAPEDKLREMAMQAVQMADSNSRITKEELERIINNAVLRMIAALYEIGFNLDGEQLAKMERIIRRGIDRRFNTVEIV